MQRLKAEITDKLHSAALQELAFSLGYNWQESAGVIREIENGWLFFHESGFIRHCHRDVHQDSPYFTTVILSDLLKIRDDEMIKNLSRPDPLPFVDDYNPFGYGDGKHDTDGHYKIYEPKVEKVRFNSDAFSHKHSSDEPPAYYGNAIRQKPRQRVYAVLGGDVCQSQ